MKTTSLAIYLSYLRKLSNEKQADVAAALDISRQTYSNYETGHRRPNTDMLIKLARYFKVPIEDMMRHSTLSTIEEHARVEDLTAAALVDDYCLKYVMDPLNALKMKHLEENEKKVLGYYNQIDPNERWRAVEIVKTLSQKGPKQF